MAIESHIFTPDNIDSWSYQEFEDWLQGQGEELQSAFADVANTPTTFEAFDPINEFPPTYDDLLAVLDYAGIPQELLVSDATLATQTINSARRFGSVSTYASSPAVSEESSELFLSDEELLSFNPFNETLTDAELLPILSDEETFARWIELHDIGETFIEADGSLFVPMNAEEFYTWFSTSEAYEETPTALETLQPNPSAKPETRITEFRGNMLELYSQTKIFYDTQLIVDISGALDLKQSPADRLPKIVLDLFVRYVELRTSSGEQSANAGIEKDLKQFIGYSDSDLASSSIEDAVARAFDGLVRVTPELFEYVNADSSTEDPYTAVLNAIRGNPTALQHLNAVTHATDIESRLLKQSRSLETSIEEIRNMDSMSGVAEFIYPFEQDAKARAQIYKMLGVSEELIATAGQERIVPGTENRTILRDKVWEKEPLFERVPCPSGVDVNTWNTACQLADAKEHIDSIETLKTIASIGGALIVGIVAGAINPALGIAAGTAVAAGFGGYDVYTESVQLSTIRAGEAVTRENVEDIYLASPESVDLAEREVDYAIIAAAVGIGLGAAGGVAGSKISSCSFKTATAYLMRSGLSDEIATGVARFAANSGYGALDSLTAAVTDGRVASKSYLVEREILAGGDGSQASVAKAVAFQVVIGTLFGMGADVGMEGVLRIFQKTASGRILYRTSEGRTIDVTNSNIIIVRDIETGQTKVVLEGHEDLPDGLDITEAFQISTRDIDSVSMKNIDLPDGVDEDSIKLAYKRAQQSGRELSVFKTPDGKVVIKDGGKDTTDSVLKDIPGLGHITGAVFSAHFHPQAPYPSRADLEIFHARAMQSPGQLQEHIIYGFAADGQPESLTLAFRYNSTTGRVESSLSGSETLNPAALSFFERLAQQIDDQVSSGTLDVSETAIHERAEQKAADRTETQSVSGKNKTKVKPRSRVTDDGMHIIPFGFNNSQDFLQFSKTLRDGLPNDVEPIFQGSAVTGVKAVTSKGVKAGTPFDQGRRSDFDIGLISEDLILQAMETRIGMSFLKTDPNRLGPIQANSDLAKVLGLNDLLLQLEAMSGREVSFCIYESHTDAYGYQQTLPVPE